MTQKTLCFVWTLSMFHFFYIYGWKNIILGAFKTPPINTLRLRLPQTGCFTHKIDDADPLVNKVSSLSCFSNTGDGFIPVPSNYLSYPLEPTAYSCQTAAWSLKSMCYNWTYARQVELHGIMNSLASNFYKNIHDAYLETKCSTSQ